MNPPPTPDRDPAPGEPTRPRRWASAWAAPLRRWLTAGGTRVDRHRLLLLAAPPLLAVAAWVAAQPVSVVNDAYSYEDTFNDNVGVDAAASTNWQNFGGFIQATGQNLTLVSACFGLPQPVGSTFDGWLFADLMLSQTAHLTAHRLEVQACDGTPLVTRTSPAAGGASIDLRGIPATTTQIRLAYTATHSATPNGTSVLPVRVDFWRVFGQATGPTTVTLTPSVSGTVQPGALVTATLAWTSTGATTRNAVLTLPLDEINGLSPAGGALVPDNGLAEDAEVDYGTGAGLRVQRPMQLMSAGNATGGVAPTLVNPGGSTTIAQAVAGTLTWNLGTVAGGASGSASVVVRSPTGTVIGARYQLRARLSHGATPLVPITGLSPGMAATATTPAATIGNAAVSMAVNQYTGVGAVGPGATGIVSYWGVINNSSASSAAPDLVNARFTVSYDTGSCVPNYAGWARVGAVSATTYPHRVISAPTVGQAATTPLVIEFDRLPFSVSWDLFTHTYDIPTTCADGSQVRIVHQVQVGNPAYTASAVRTHAVAANSCHSVGTGVYLHRMSQATPTGSAWTGGAWPGQPEFYEIFGSNGHARAGEYFSSWSPYASESARTHTVRLDRTYAVLTVQPGVTFHGVANYGEADRIYKDSTGTAPLPGAAGFDPLADPPHPAWRRVTVNLVRTTQSATAGQISHDPAVAGNATITPFSAAPNDANPSAVVAPGTRLMMVKWDDNPPWQGPDFGNFHPQLLWRMADGAYGVAEPADGTLVSVNTGLRQWSYRQGVSPGDVPQDCGATSAGTTRKGAFSRGVVRQLWLDASAVPAGGSAALTLIPENLNAASARVDGRWVVNLFNVRSQVDLDQVTGSVLTAGLNIPAGGNAATITFTAPNRTACLAATSAADPACMAVWTVPPDTQLPNGWGHRVAPRDDYTAGYRFRLLVPILRTAPAGGTLTFTAELRNGALTALGADNAAPTSLHAASNYTGTVNATVLESPLVSAGHSGPANWPRNSTFTWVATVRNDGNAASNGIWAVSRLPVAGRGGTQFTPGLGRLYTTLPAAQLVAETSTSAACYDSPTTGTWTPLSLAVTARSGYAAESTAAIPAGSQCVRVRRAAAGGAAFAANAGAFGYALDIALANTTAHDGLNLTHRVKAGALAAWGSNADLAPVETSDLVTQQNTTVITSATKAPVPDLTRAGFVRWDASWRNVSGTTSGPVTVVDTVPPELVFDGLAGALPAGTSCVPSCAVQGAAGDGSGGTLTLVTTSLAADDGNPGAGGDERALGLWMRVRAGVADGTTVSNCLSTNPGAGGIGSNQCVPATTAALTLTLAQVVIPSQGGSPPLVSPNDTLRYTLTVVNNAATPQFVRVFDALPADVDYVPGSFQVDGAGAGDAAFAANVLSYTSSAAVAAGATHTLRYDVRVRGNAANGTDILNTVNATQCTDNLGPSSCRIAKLSGQVAARVSATASINGTVFEDVHYGGGAGRSLATSVGVPRPGARVELYQPNGNFHAAATTDASGRYSFTGLWAGDWTVRVATGTVTSSRSGAAAGQWPVQTFRVAWNGSVHADDTARVGGESPGTADAGSNSNGSLNSLNAGNATPHSLATVRATTGAVSGIDFGFHFATVVNTNDSGQGSLRQAITNANALGGHAALAQAGRLAGIEHVVFMIGNGSNAPGLRAANNFFGTNGGDAMVASVTLAGTLPQVTQPLVIDAQTQPGWSSANPRPIVGSLRINC